MLNVRDIWENSPKNDRQVFIDSLSDEERAFYIDYVEGAKKLDKDTVLGVKISELNDYLKERLRSKAKLTNKDYLLMAAYAKLKLQKEGIDDVKMNLFVIDRENTNKRFGSYTMSTKTINVYVNNLINDGQTMEDVLHTLIHESNHAIQFHKLSRNDIDSVNMVAFFLDEMVEQIYGKDAYYYPNYNTISYEFDAEYEAYRELRKLVDAPGDTEERITKEVAGLSIEEQRIFERYIKEGKEYIQAEYRFYNKNIYMLSDLALKAVNDHKEDLTAYRNHPVFNIIFKKKQDGTYEYRSEEELKEMYDKETDETKKVIYKAVIASKAQYMNDLKTFKTDNKMEFLTKLKAITDFRYAMLYYYTCAGESIKYDYEILDYVLNRNMIESGVKLDILNEDFITYITQNPTVICKVSFSNPDKTKKFIKKTWLVPKEYHPHIVELFKELPMDERKKILEKNDTLVKGAPEVLLYLDEPRYIDSVVTFKIIECIGTDKERYKFYKPALIKCLTELENNKNKKELMDKKLKTLLDESCYKDLMIEYSIIKNGKR